jgi:Bacterial Ig domain
VTLSGSGSDPDGDPLTFSWSGPCGSASTAVATLTCPIGVSTMTLTVNDGRGGTASASVAIAVLGPMDIKKSVLGDLTALRAKVTDKQDRDKLDDAVDSLTDSLNGHLWIDQTHIDSQHGDKVFDAEKESAGKLQELIKKKKTTIAGATLQAFINRITGADRLLALIAISDAQQRKGDLRHIAKAGEELAKGNADLSKGKFSDAIDHYSSAWKLAL